MISNEDDSRVPSPRRVSLRSDVLRNMKARFDFTWGPKSVSSLISEVESTNSPFLESQRLMIKVYRDPLSDSSFFAVPLR